MPATHARRVERICERMEEADPSRPFGHHKGAPEPESFSQLPPEVYEHDQIRTHWGGRPLWDLIILSKLAYHHHLRQKQDGTIHVKYDGCGHVEPLEPGEFALSIETICEDYLARIGADRTFSREENTEHERFYQLVYSRIRKLEDLGFIRRVRTVGDETHNGRLGTVWSFEGTELQGFSGTNGTEDRQGSEYAEWRIEQGKTFNPFDLIGEDCEAVAKEKYTYVQTEAATSLDQGRFDVEYFSWTESVAKTGVKGDRYVRMGTQSESEDGWMLPWIRWDIDGEDPFDSYEIARRIEEQLEIEGVDTSEVLVAFTGGRGFHVMIPSGMLGNPVFETRREAEKTLRQLTLRTIDEEVDHALFNPYHLARCIGSQHPSTGLYMQAMPLSELQRTPMIELMSSAREFTSFDLPDPREADPDWTLVSRLQHAKNGGFWMPPMDEVGGWDPENASIKDEILDRIDEGVSESEAWGTDLNIDYIGRNRAAFEMSRHLLLEGIDQPLRHLQEWNRQNDPALSENELKRTFSSAQRYV